MNARAFPEMVVIPRPDQALMQSADELLLVAQASYGEIKTQEAYEAAAEDLKIIKGRQKQLEDLRSTITKPLIEAERAVRALFKHPQDTLLAAERILKRSILAFQDLEDRRRREQEAQAAEAMRREREKLEERAARAEASGRHEQAEVLRTAASTLPEHIAITSSTPRVQGIAARSTWRAVVTDKHALVKYVAEHPEWLNLVEANSSALNGLARAQKSALAIPGVKAAEDRGLAAGS